MTDDRSSNPELEWFEEQLRDKRIAELEYEQWARRARNAEARERELLAMHHEDQARIARLEEALGEMLKHVAELGGEPTADCWKCNAARQALADKGEGREGTGETECR